MDNARDGRHDFDFFFGRWHVANHRLARRLEGCTVWEEFAAEVEAAPILGGLGNLDTFTCPRFADGRPLAGATLRLFDPGSRRWSLYWADDRSHVLQPPVHGRFEAGRGEFHGDDSFAGRPIRVRFVWSVLGADAARWEQAFSSDGGVSWEDNWRMEMSRVS